MRNVNGDKAVFDEFEGTGSTYEPVGDVMKNGLKIDPIEYDALTEISMICSLCNDSSIDYNTAKGIYEKVGEATETALTILVEKMNVLNTTKSGLRPKELGTACNLAMQQYWK